MHKIVLVGPQGSGKGTQGELLAARFSIPTISIGALFRKNVADGTELGKEIEGVLAAGNLVDDELTKRVMAERLKQDDAKNGFILDGYPRNEKQRKDLEDITSIDHVFMINLSDEEAVKRVSGRRQCKNGHIYHIDFSPPKEGDVCDNDGEELIQRDDDTEEAVKQRLAVYHNDTEPLLAGYREQGVVHDVDGSQSVKDVQKQIIDFLT